MAKSPSKASGKKRQSKLKTAQRHTPRPPPKQSRPPKAAAAPSPPLKPSEINPFDLAGLVVRPSYKTATGMITSAAAIPVKNKAGPATFFMTHPDPEYAQELYVLKWSENGDEKDSEWYVVHPNAARAIEDDPILKSAKIYYCISQTGQEFLVPVPVSDSKGGDFSSKHAVFEEARGRFLKMFWAGTTWVTKHAETDGPEPPPAWTEESYSSILKRGLPNGRSRDLPVPVQRASAHARVSDHAGSSWRSR
jgi:hypothetical protein